MSGIADRKADHIDLCLTDEVAFRNKTTLLEDVVLHHSSLPEVALEDIDTSLTLFGKKLRAPILIAGMTGGHERARDINKGLSAVAERCGYAFGLGSQRAIQKDPALLPTYQVRDVAPNTLVLGNIGVIQAAQQGIDESKRLVEVVGADALCIHLNPAQEMIQPEGDRDFRGAKDALSDHAANLGVPVIAKETGAGIGARVASELWQLGVHGIDVGGAGGTSWVGVEAKRAEGRLSELGELFWDWGVPTAASVVFANEQAQGPVIATGGIQNGLDVARAIALGASCAGIARKVFQAFMSEGEAGAENYLSKVERELRVAMLLTASRNLEELRQTPRVLGPRLRSWIES